MINFFSKYSDVANSGSGMIRFFSKYSNVANSVNS
jgi:hypothetical protein